MIESNLVPVHYAVEWGVLVLNSASYTYMAGFIFFLDFPFFLELLILICSSLIIWSKSID